ncbi:ribosomal protein S18-alanine N-acetyltransferase [Aliikangiella sp. IMCC44359]|uniref:ribosomal protein S18-alanine N-acetyltransferase n=1 Tax=Aliikangiella sp. IMCC44359 TaxID=3459125 RepID=UPI00403A7CDD
MSNSISDAKVDDVKALVELEQLVFIPSDGMLNQISFRYHIQKKKNLLLVARSDKLPYQLMGYILVLLHKRSARIYSLAINPEHQKRGIGSELIKASINRAQEKGIMKVSLELRKDNSVAFRLYESLGFIVSGVRPDYYQRGDDAIVMTWQKK